MALSYVEYPGNGSTKAFDLTFGYLSRTHVFAFVNNSLVAYKWASPTRVELVNTPPAGSTVKIARLTDRVTRITTFADGQTLLSGDLNAGDLQNFYILQEIADGIADGVIAGTIVVNEPGSGYITEQWIQQQLEASVGASSALQQLAAQISAETAARTNSLLAEAQARAAAITAEANARIAVAQDLLEEEVARAEGIAAEASARASAIAAEASARGAAVLALEQEDLALGQRLDTVEADINTPTTGLKAKIATLDTVTADLETGKAEASTVTALTATANSIPAGANALVDTGFHFGSTYYAAEVGGNVSAPTVTDASLPSGMRRRFVQATAAGAWGGSTDNFVSFRSFGTNGLKVTPGETVGFRLRVGWNSNTARVDACIEFRTLAGALISRAATVTFTGTGVGVGLGERETYSEAKGVATVPAGAEVAYIAAYSYPTAAGTAAVRVAEPVLARLRAGQTEPPQYSGQLDVTTGRVATAEANIVNIQSTTADLSANKADASTVTLIDAKIEDPTTGLKARATSLESRMSSVETGKASTTVTDAIDAKIEAPTTGLKARATSLESRVSSVETGKASTTVTDAIDAKIETPTTGLKARATSLENRMSSVETGKASTTVTDAIDAKIEAPTTGLKARQTTAEASIASLQSVVVDLENDKAESTTVTALDSRVTGLRGSSDGDALPSTFEKDDLYWTTVGGSFVDEAGIGRVFQSTSVAHSVRSRGRIQLRPGRTYRFTARYRVKTDASNGVTVQPLAGLTTYNSAGVNVAGIWVGSFVNRTVADGWVTVTGDFTTAAILGAHAEAVAIDSYCQPHWHPSNSNSNAVTQVQFVKLEDVSDIVSANANITTLQNTVTNLQTGKAEASVVTALSATVSAGQNQGNFPTNFVQGLWAAHEHEYIHNSSHLFGADRFFVNSDGTRVFRTTPGVSEVISPMGSFVPQPGRKYVCRWRVRKIANVTNGRPSVHYPYFVVKRADGGTDYLRDSVSSPGDDGANYVLNQWYTIEVVWTVPSSPAFAWARPRWHFNWDNAGTFISDAAYEFGAFEFEDQTAVSAANANITTLQNTVVDLENSKAEASALTSLTARVLAEEQEARYGENLLPNTEWLAGKSDGSTGWYQGWGGNHGLPIDNGFPGGTSWTGTIRTYQIRVVGTPANGTVADGMTLSTWGNLEELKKWSPRLRGGERIYAGTYMGAHRCSSRVVLAFFDAAGNSAGEVHFTGGYGGAGGAGGEPANFERVGGFCTVPANARYVCFIHRMLCTGDPDPYLFHGWPMIAYAAPNQTVAPPYSPGGMRHGSLDKLVAAEANITNLQSVTVDLENSKAEATDLTSLRARVQANEIPGALNINPRFSAPFSAGALPDGWYDWVNATGNAQFLVKPVTPGSTYYLAGAAGVPSGIAQLVYGIKPGGKYLLAGEIYRASGSLRAAGLYIEWRDESNTWLGNAYLSFGTTKTTDGYTGYYPDRVTRYEKVVTAPAGAYRASLYVMNNWDGHGAQEANAIYWFEASLSAVGYSEAQVDILRTALATGNSAEATLMFKVNTTTNAAVIRAYAAEGDGVWNGSAISLDANYIILNGNVVVNGTLTAPKIANGELTKSAVDSNTTGITCSTTYQDVAELTLNVVSSASLVRLDWSMAVFGSSSEAGDNQLLVRVLRDGVDITGDIEMAAITATAAYTLYSGGTAVFGDEVKVPNSVRGMFAYVMADVGAAAGNRVYKLQAKRANTNGTWTIGRNIMFATCHAR